MNSSKSNNSTSQAPPPPTSTNSNNNNNNNPPPLSVTGQPINVNDVGSNLAAVTSSSTTYPSPLGQSTSMDGSTSDYNDGANSNINKPLLSRQNSEDTALTAASSSAEGELPNNVSTEAQLAQLPDVCLNTKPHNNMKQRPLRHVDELGRVSTYSLTPMRYSVIFILLIEL